MGRPYYYLNCSTRKSIKYLLAIGSVDLFLKAMPIVRTIGGDISLVIML